MQDNRASMWVNKSIYWVGPPPHQVLISRSIAERLASVHSLDQYRFFLLKHTAHIELSHLEAQMLALRRPERQQRRRTNTRLQELFPNASLVLQAFPFNAMLDPLNAAERQRKIQGRIEYLQMLLVEMEAQSQKVDEQYHALAVELNIAGTHTRPLDERGAARMDGRLNEIRFVIRKKGDEQEAVTEEMNNVGNFISSISSHLLPSTPDTFVEVRSKREADAFLYNIGPIEKFKANRLREAAHSQQSASST
ncbi:hypothetical protein, conserved [Eimeria praecox]|uniref:Uncharacterized protein n=1 Tax=Eimeria praecox TaxID=51316 RepID=U6G7W0_9EIME|nr:hypothetical protein, conserved [Eimeria praecox]